MITQSDRIVFVLGAGFSAQAGLPVMARFADAARRRYFTLKAADPKDDLLPLYDKMFDFQRECERSAGVFLRDWENIEELYTQADLRRLSQIPSKLEAESLCASIAWVLWDVYRGGVLGFNDVGPMDLMGVAIKKLHEAKGLSCVVLTTNYDLVVESGLVKNGMSVSYAGFDLRSATVFSHFECVRQTDSLSVPKGSVPIIKLHGSVNWFDVGTSWVCSRHFTPSDMLNSVTTPTITYAQVVAQLRGLDTSKPEMQVRPAIIPPMLGKVSTQSVIAAQWRAAIDALRSARCVVVVGYSFPETDTFMTRLLAEGMHRNDDIERLVVVDIADPDLWRAKLSRLCAPVFLDKKVAYVRMSAADAAHYIQNWGVDGLVGKRAF